MRSRLRSTTKSNSNERKLQVTKVYYPPPKDKEFIAYSTVMKQSNSGMASHERFLLFDSFSKSLRYYSKKPSALPTPTDLPEGKQIVFLKKVRNFEFKSAKTNVGKALVSWYDLNGEKKNSWALTFSSNELMNDWVIVVNEAKQDGHLRPQDRPVVRRDSKLKNPEKYETQFIKTTGGIVSRKSSSLQKSQNQNGLISSDSKNNSDWITKMTIEKEQQIEQNRKQFQLGSNSEQKPQDKMQVPNKVQVRKQDKSSMPTLFNKPPLIKDNQVGRTRYNRISVIPEVEDSSKMSKREYKQLQSESTKNFRIQRQPPLPIPETEELDQSNIKNMSNSQIRDHQSQTKQGKSDSDLTKKLNEKSIAFDEQGQSVIEVPKLRSRIDTLITSDKKNNQQAADGFGYIDETKYYPYVYWSFIQKCQQLGVLIIENLPMLVKSAEEKPNPGCHIDEEGILRIQKDGIEFKYRFANQEKSGDHEWSCSSLKMQHYSSMVEYISRLSHNMPISFAAVIPIPCCVISHKWQQISCKAVISKQYKLISRSDEQKLNTFFQIPTGSWRYYRREQSLLVDYAIDNLKINSDPDDDTVFELCEDICKQETQIGHIKDLLLYCRSRFSLHVDSTLIVRLLQRIKQDSNRHIFTTLMSILFGIKSAKYIRMELVDKIHLLDPTQMYENIDAYIKAFTIDNKCSINDRIMNLITCELQSKNIYIRKAVPDVHSVFTTMVSVLGLQLYKNGNKQENRHSIRFAPFVHTLSAQGISHQMASVESALRNCQASYGNEDAKLQNYELITNLSSKFQYLWVQSETANKAKNSSRSLIQPTYRSSYYSNPNTYRDSKQIRGERAKSTKWVNKGKYLNNYYRIMHYKSLYEPYLFHNESFHAYSAQLQSIFNEEPPSYFSYLIGINCIKWTSKLGKSNHDFVIKMLHDQILNCKEWAGKYSPFLLSYYELYAVYAEQIFDLYSAVQNARYALQLVIQIYGDDSAQAAEKWFLLANILVEGEFYEEALEAYLKSIEVLKKSQINNGVLSRTVTSSRTTLLSWRVNTGQAQFTVHMKLMKTYLALGDTKNCLAECSRCHRAVQQFIQSKPADQLQILNTIVRCYELTRQQDKLMQMIQIISIQFGNRIIDMNSSIGKQSLQFQQHLRESMIKICLSPEIQFKIDDKIRKNFLLSITKAIRQKYEGRFTKKQYNSYLTKIVCQQSMNSWNIMETSRVRKNEAGDKPFNLIQWFVDVFKELPVFPINRNKSEGYNPNLDINYNLHQNPINSRIQPVTQPKLLLIAMRIIQALSGILGFSYLESCFSY